MKKLLSIFSIFTIFGNSSALVNSCGVSNDNYNFFTKGLKAVIQAGDAKLTILNNLNKGLINYIEEITKKNIPGDDDDGIEESFFVWSFVKGIKDDKYADKAGNTIEYDLTFKNSDNAEYIQYKEIINNFFNILYSNGDTSSHLSFGDTIYLSQKILANKTNDPSLNNVSFNSVSYITYSNNNYDSVTTNIVKQMENQEYTLKPNVNIAKAKKDLILKGLYYNSSNDFSFLTFVEGATSGVTFLNNALENWGKYEQNQKKDIDYYLQISFKSPQNIWNISNNLDDELNVTFITTNVPKVT